MSINDDLATLKTLLEYETLDEWEKKAFASMRDKLERGKPLTAAQRTKVDEACKRLDVDLDRRAKNLWSSGKIPEGKPLDFPYNLHRPLRPPGK
jgi:hypothetical protein